MDLKKLKKLTHPNRHEHLNDFKLSGHAAEHKRHCDRENPQNDKISRRFSSDAFTAHQNDHRYKYHDNRHDPNPWVGLDKSLGWLM